METFHLGIDISKATFDVGLLFCGDHRCKTKKFTNDTQGFSELKAWLTTHKVKVDQLHACMEATGCYGQQLAHYLYANHYKISVENPARIKAFAASRLTRVKTDKSDCQMIAHFCYTMKPKLWEPTAQHIALLQQWVGRLDDLINLRNQESNRLEGKNGDIAANIQRVVSFIAQEIQEVEAHIKQLIQKHEDLRNKSRLITSIPGIGEKTAACLLALIPIEKFKSAKKIVAFVGLNPKLKQSGSSVHKGSSISKMGNKQLRGALYLPAVVATKWNPTIRAMAQRLTAAGKAKKVIIIAAMRKLIHIVYGVLKQEAFFTVDTVSTCQTKLEVFNEIKVMSLAS